MQFVQLPDEYPPKTYQLPLKQGIGLEIPPRTVPPSWPQDWWQRNFDTLDEDGPDPEPFTGRQLVVPPAPVGAR